MSPNGQIHTPEQIEKLSERARKDLVPILSGELPKVRAMDIEQRKAWYARKRAASKAARKARRRNRR